jgi:tRNA dimethylallyltransferase
MLIYKGPQIITAKPNFRMLSEINHHFVGTISVEEAYSVFDYYSAATKTIRDLFHQNIPAIVCGGSGLYVKSLLDGIFEGVGRDEGLRKKLEERAHAYGKEYLYAELKSLDEPAAKKISPSDLKRIIRALEVYYLTGMPISKKQAYSFGLWQDLPIKIFGLRLERKELYRRIEERLERMFKEGAVDEVIGLRQFNLSLTAKKIIGIKEIGEYLDGRCTLEKAKEEMKKNTRHFAKRQMTWFRADKRIEWIDISGKTPEEVCGVILGKIEAE